MGESVHKNELKQPITETGVEQRGVIKRSILRSPQAWFRSCPGDGLVSLFGCRWETLKGRAAALRTHLVASTNHICTIQIYKPAFDDNVWAAGANLSSKQCLFESSAKGKMCPAPPDQPCWNIIFFLMFNIAGGGVWSQWLAKPANLKLIYNPFLIKNKQIRQTRQKSLHTFSRQRGEKKQES